MSAAGTARRPVARREVPGRWWAPVLLAGPGLLYLAVLFLGPAATLVATSLMVPEPGADVGVFRPALEVGTYASAVAEYWPEYLRSVGYAAAATAAALVVAFPVAYAIALKVPSATVRQLLLVTVISPFLVGYVLRILAWRQILADEGWVVSGLQALGVLGESGRLTATAFAVVAGLAYTFLPFMILPIYAVLAQLDRGLLHAAADAYATAPARFWHVTLPLAVPGVLAGTLLTFIPAMGDFVNAALLGNPRTTMVGSIIDARFFAVLDYPTASALAVVLMSLTAGLVLVYLRRFGSEGLAR